MLAGPGYLCSEVKLLSRQSRYHRRVNVDGLTSVIEHQGLVSVVEKPEKHVHFYIRYASSILSTEVPQTKCSASTEYLRYEKSSMTSKSAKPGGNYTHGAHLPQVMRRMSVSLAIMDVVSSYLPNAPCIADCFKADATDASCDPRSCLGYRKYRK